MPEAKCPPRETLELFLANELPEDEVAGVRLHLGRCQACVEALEILKQPSTLSSPCLPVPVKDAPAHTGRYEFLAPPEREDELGRLGPFRVLRLLGEGGMGMVFLAEELALERHVALKIMKSSESSNDIARQRFIQEGKVVAKIQHDHIITVYQVGEENNTPYLSMQYLEGEALDRRVKREGPLPAAEIVRIGSEMAEGLHAAHEHGLIHRDIKPANIYLQAPKGRVKVLDFGLARSIGGASGMTQSGVVVGTPDFMAPEQARGQPLDARSDVFSLGCVLYYMCTGRKPFHGDDILSTLLAVANEQPFPIRKLNPAIPPVLVERIAAMMAKHPNDRLKSMRAVAVELGFIEKEQGPGDGTRPGTDSDKTAPYPAVDKQPASADKTKSRLRSATPAPAPRQPSHTPLPRSTPTPIPTPLPTPAMRQLQEIGLTSADESMALETPLQTTRADLERVPEIKKPITSKPKPASAAPPPPTRVPAMPSPPPPAPPESPPPGQQACPRCGSRKLSSVGWCLQCGYTPAAGAAAAATGRDPGTTYIYVLFVGVALILGNTAVGYWLLPRGTRIWSQFIRMQMYTGLGLFALAHLWAYTIAWPFHDNSRSFLPLLSTPTRVWQLTIKLLPRTRLPLCVFTWALSAILCALFLAGDLDFWLRDHDRFEMALPEMPLVMMVRDLPGSSSNNVLDATAIGFVERDQQITGIILGVRAGKGWKYVGVANEVGKEAAKDSAIVTRRLVLLQRRDPVVPGLDVEGAAWVDPELSCRVQFARRDPNQILEGAIVVQWHLSKK